MPDVPDFSGSPDATAERRRFPRVSPDADLQMCVPAVVDAEVLDISSAGALISTAAPLQVSQRALLRTLLGGEPFSAWFEVRRIGDSTGRGSEIRHHFGVTFAPLQEQAQRTLQRFVKADARQI